MLLFLCFCLMLLKMLPNWHPSCCFSSPSPGSVKMKTNEAPFKSYWYYVWTCRQIEPSRHSFLRSHCQIWCYNLAPHRINRIFSQLIFNIPFPSGTHILSWCNIMVFPGKMGRCIWKRNYYYWRYTHISLKHGEEGFPPPIWKKNKTPPKTNKSSNRPWKWASPKGK